MRGTVEPNDREVRDQTSDVTANNSKRAHGRHVRQISLLLYLQDSAPWSSCLTSCPTRISDSSAERSPNATWPSLPPLSTPISHISLPTARTPTRSFADREKKVWTAASPAKSSLTHDAAIEKAVRVRFMQTLSSPAYLCAELSSAQDSTDSSIRRNARVSYGPNPRSIQTAAERKLRRIGKAKQETRR